MRITLHVINYVSHINIIKNLIIKHITETSNSLLFIIQYMNIFIQRFITCVNNLYALVTHRFIVRR